jgi:hypothetical protein
MALNTKVNELNIEIEDEIVLALSKVEKWVKDYREEVDLFLSQFADYDFLDEKLRAYVDGPFTNYLPESFFSQNRMPNPLSEAAPRLRDLRRKVRVIETMRERVLMMKDRNGEVQIQQHDQLWTVLGDNKVWAA